MDKILKDIVETRIKKIKQKGHNFGLSIPDIRKVPVIKPDLSKGFLICEIKRASPSEGKMNNINDPVSWARKYYESGADVISVLTEEDYFFGNLADLMAIKRNFPERSVLRKDFLIDEKDIEVSYLAGADIVLLIVSVLINLDPDHSITLIKKMKEKAESYGMLPLIEVHNIDELQAVLHLNPVLIGINSRDLKSFKINRNYPLGLRHVIPDNVTTIYESGVRGYSDAFFAAVSGFKALLIGSSIVKSENLEQKIQEVRSGFLSGLKNRSRFYNDLFYKIYIEKKVAVKICGITNLDDALFAAESGADIIGFVFAESPRNISYEKAKEISLKLPKDLLKVAVVVDENIDLAVSAVRDGWLDAIQFHGDYDNDFCQSYNCCWYKAVRVKDSSSFDNIFYSPIILLDAFSKESYGGTGKQIDYELVEFAKDKIGSLFLAGGITSDNVVDIINRFQPFLIDVSSGVEEYPGKKDHKKIATLFEKIRGIAQL